MRPTRYGVFGYSVGGEGRERPLVACWILLMLAFLLPLFAIVPVAVLLGYLLRVLDASAGGDAAPRFLTAPRSLVRRGVGAVVVVVGYLAVPVAALLVTVYGAMTGVGEGDVSAAQSLLLYGGSTAVLVLFIVAAYLVPAALATYAESGSLGRAFGPGALRPLAGHAAYFARWMAGAVTVGLTAALASVGLQVRHVGPVVASLILAYGLLLAVHVWGLGVKRARERQ